GDVMQCDEDVYQSARHAKGFVAKPSVKKDQRSLSDCDAFRVERQCDHVSICVDWWVNPSFVHAQLGVGDELADVFYLGARAGVARTVHNNIISSPRETGEGVILRCCHASSKGETD